MTESLPHVIPADVDCKLSEEEILHLTDDPETLIGLLPDESDGKCGDCAMWYNKG